MAIPYQDLKSLSSTEIILAMKTWFSTARQTRTTLVSFVSIAWTRLPVFIGRSGFETPRKFNEPRFNERPKCQLVSTCFAFKILGAISTSFMLTELVSRSFHTLSLNSVDNNFSFCFNNNKYCNISSNKILRMDLEC